MFYLLGTFWQPPLQGSNQPLYFLAPPPGVYFEEIFATRQREADEFYGTVLPRHLVTQDGWLTVAGGQPIAHPVCAGANRSDAVFL